MITGERMKSRRKELGLSAEDVAKALGVSRATIYRYEKGDIEKVPGQALEPIAKALRTTPAYLMGWETAEDAHLPSCEPDSCYVRYAGPVAAHFNATLPEMHELRPVLQEWLNNRSADDFFMASVDGNSMYPHFQHGDEILCQRCSNQLECSDHVGIVILRNEEATLKKIRFFSDPPRMELEPFNPNFMPEIISGSDLEQCKVVGRVIRLIRNINKI